MRCPGGIDAQVWQQVEALLGEEWSPEQIVGRMELEQGVRITHEWICHYDLLRQTVKRRSVPVFALSEGTAQTVRSL